MSRKASAVKGNPTDDTGSPVLGQDYQGREEMSASLNSGAEPRAGVQSTPTQSPPVSRQGSGSGKRKKSTRSRKHTETYSLTTRQQTPKTRKAKARNARGVKASDAKGTKSSLVQGVGRGGRAADLLSRIKPDPKKVQLPDTSDSSDAEGEEEVRTQPPSHSLQEGKSDQPALLTSDSTSGNFHLW